MLVPPLDGGGGAGLQPMHLFLDGSGEPCILGVIPRGIGAVMGNCAWYHAKGP